MLAEPRVSALLCAKRLESHFRRLAGESGYEGGFFEHYLIPLLYPVQYTTDSRVTLALLVLALNVGSVRHAVLAPPRSRRLPAFHGRS